jgi:putative transposase
MTIPFDPMLASDAERRKQVALFRYGLIADLVQLPAHHRGLYKLLDEKAAREYEIPGTLRRHVATETMRGWLRDYRRGGFDALLPKVRSDLGAARAIPPHVVDLLCELKDADPDLSIPLVIKKAREEHAAIVSDELELPLSTVHRLLGRRGLTKKRKDDGTSKDRRRFEYDEANELWMSDVMYGPKLRAAGRLRQTYLIAFLDDATRMIPHASFALTERTAAYLPAPSRRCDGAGPPSVSTSTTARRFARSTSRSCARSSASRSSTRRRARRRARARWSAGFARCACS